MIRMIEFIMNKILGIFFLIFILSTTASAEDSLVDTCNKGLIVLKNYGFNFQNFTPDTYVVTNANSATCGFPPNSDQMVSFHLNPLRIHVTDPGFGNFDGHCIYPSTGQIEKSRLSECRGW